MSERVWYRSLYWRIALGIIVLLIVVLVVQGLIFVWLVSRAREALPLRALQQAARSLTVELQHEIAQDPDLDLERFVRDRENALSRPILLVWRDGRVFTAGMDQPPEWLVEIARARLARNSSATSDDDTRPRRNLGYAPVVLNGELSAVVAILPGPPLQTLLREFAPELLAVALALTIGGTSVAALLIFGPAHRRLRGLEAAAHNLGAGNPAARAPDTGGDEIATVARSFNAMASEIVRRADALQAADRARRQLLADVSHELMTPLTAMRGYVETLRLPDLRIDDAARNRYLSIVLEETLRMEHLIGDLLDLARLEAGGTTLTVKPVQVNDLFSRVHSRHERLLLEKDVTMEATIGPGAGELEGDGDRLEQALQNLATNALRHTPRGGRIRLEAAAAGDDRLRIQVADNGQGIAPEHLPYVFDRFYKTDTSRTSSGSGLGLSIVRAIVERHGGQIEVRSKPNVETVFEMFLPKAPSARAPVSTAA